MRWKAQLQIFGRVLLSFGMGYNTFEDGGKQLVSQFLEGESVRFMDLIGAYVKFASQMNSNIIR